MEDYRLSWYHSERVLLWKSSDNDPEVHIHHTSKCIEQKLQLDEVWSYTDLIKEIGKEKAYKNRYQRNRLAAISGDNDLSNDSG